MANEVEEWKNVVEEERSSETIVPSTNELVIKLGGYDFYHQVLKSPKYVAAPMVDASELAFRMLCRKYGAQLCYTPMLHGKTFAENKSYRTKYFSTCPEDRPLIAQFCANDPQLLLKAAKHIEGVVDAVDINLGCPQRIARRGYYGSFLMENLPLVYSMVRILHDNLRVPVFCKIRRFPEYEKTLEYAKGLEAAGCQLLVVHGRTREMKGIHTGLADWDVVRKLKQELRIPVISNGNLRYFEDIQKCLDFTKADGVMSAEALLKNPAFFSGTIPEPFQLAYEYLDLAEKYTTPLGWIKDHLCKILINYVVEDTASKDNLFMTRSLTELRASLKEFEAACKQEGGPPKKRENLVRQKNWVDDSSSVLTDALGLLG